MFQGYCMKTLDHRGSGCCTVIIAEMVVVVMDTVIMETVIMVVEIVVVVEE